MADFGVVGRYGVGRWYQRYFVSDALREPLKQPINLAALIAVSALLVVLAWIAYRAQHKHGFATGRVIAGLQDSSANEGDFLAD